MIIEVLDHGLTTERGRIEALQTGIESDLKSLDEAVRSLSDVWQDAKSVGFISQLIAMVSNIKIANTRAKKSTDEYLEAIGKILNLYGE